MLGIADRRGAAVRLAGRQHEPQRLGRSSSPTGSSGRCAFSSRRATATASTHACCARSSALPGVQVAVPVLEQNANVVGPVRVSSRSTWSAPTRASRASADRRCVAQPRRRHWQARVFMLERRSRRKIGVDSLRPVELQIGARTSRSCSFRDLLGRATRRPRRRARSRSRRLRTVQRLTATAGPPDEHLRAARRRALDRVVRAELERLAGGRAQRAPGEFTQRCSAGRPDRSNQSTGLFAAISALVGFLFAFNALLLPSRSAASLIEDLRLDGYTRGMIVEVLLFDALVLGVDRLRARPAARARLCRSRCSAPIPATCRSRSRSAAQRIVTLPSVALAVGGWHARGVPSACSHRCEREIFARPGAGSCSAPAEARSGAQPLAAGGSATAWRPRQRSCSRRRRRRSSASSA